MSMIDVGTAELEVHQKRNPQCELDLKHQLLEFTIVLNTSCISHKQA